jgi:transcription initiation factor TFIID TATA-box-binding protein
VAGVRNSASLKVVSMVTKADFGGYIDPHELMNRSPKCIYEPDQFPAMFYRFTEPKITFAIFSSGKVMGYGGRSINEVLRCFESLVRVVKPLLSNPETIEAPEICMLVSAGRIAETLDIARIAREVRGVIYEPEQFPGLIWHRPNRVVVLLFNSGKVVITGAKSELQMNQLFEDIVQTVSLIA